MKPARSGAHVPQLESPDATERLCPATKDPEWHNLDPNPTQCNVPGTITYPLWNQLLPLCFNCLNSFPVMSYLGLCVSSAGLWSTQGWVPILISLFPVATDLLPHTCSTLEFVMIKGKSLLCPDYVPVKIRSVFWYVCGWAEGGSKEWGCWRETEAIWSIMFQSNFFIALRSWSN